MLDPPSMSCSRPQMFVKQWRAQRRRNRHGRMLPSRFLVGHGLLQVHRERVNLLQIVAFVASNRQPVSPTTVVVTHYIGPGNGRDIGHLEDTDMMK
jgi:hypothetical protein